jgi:hypothetical protein
MPARALAQDGDVVAPAPQTHAPVLMARPFQVGAGLGLLAGFSGGVSFRLVEHAGYRFVGFDLGASVELALWAGVSLGQAFGDNGFYGLNFDGTFGADLLVWNGGDLQLVVTPMLSLGAVVVGGNGYGADAGFHVQFAAQAELVMVEGLLGVWLRPLVFDGFVRDGGFGAYSFLGGVTFHL